MKKIVCEFLKVFYALCVIYSPAFVIKLIVLLGEKTHSIILATVCGLMIWCVFFVGGAVLLVKPWKKRQII